MLVYVESWNSNALLARTCSWPRWCGRSPLGLTNQPSDLQAIQAHADALSVSAFDTLGEVVARRLATFASSTPEEYAKRRTEQATRHEHARAAVRGRPYESALALTRWVFLGHLVALGLLLGATALSAGVPARPIAATVLAGGTVQALLIGLSAGRPQTVPRGLMALTVAVGVAHAGGPVRQAVESLPDLDVFDPKLFAPVVALPDGAPIAEAGSMSAVARTAAIPALALGAVGILIDRLFEFGSAYPPRWHGVVSLGWVALMATPPVALSITRWRTIRKWEQSSHRTLFWHPVFAPACLPAPDPQHTPPAPKRVVF